MNTSLASMTKMAGGVDVSNSGLNLRAPVRLEGNYTLTNSMTGNSATGVGGVLNFTGSIYDDPFKAPATLTLASNGASGRTLLSGFATHRGGTVIQSGTAQVANAQLSPFASLGSGAVGSATGTGNVTVNAGARLIRGSAAGDVGFIIPANGKAVNVNGTLQPGVDVPGGGIMTVGAADRNVSVGVTGASSR